jgi:Protein of unknown function (DUF1759)/Putative peptidase (DUF1758)
MGDIEKALLAKRGSIKARVTIFANYLKGFNRLEVLDADQRSMFKARLAKFETAGDDFEEVQQKLEALEEDPTQRYEERGQFEEQFFSALGFARDVVLAGARSTTESWGNADSGESEPRPNSGRSVVKLPTIQLPTYDGSYKRWLEFHDTFSALIHHNNAIEPISKFHYLRASLEGSAALVIKSLEFSAANYTVAWGLLCERFQNKRLLINHHVTALFKLDDLKEESSKGIRNLVDTVNTNLRALETLGEPTEKWDTLINYMVASKLDQVTLRKWEERRVENEVVTFEMLTHFLKNRADLLEITEYRGETKPAQPRTQENKPQRTQDHGSGSRNVSLKRDYTCPICKGEHAVYNCKTFLALSSRDRESRIRDANRCLNCLTSGHWANTCRKPPCQKCQKQHNILLHPTQRDSNPETDGGVTLMVRAKAQQAFLTTALVMVMDQQGVFHRARAILDNASSSHFIQDEFRRRLGLQTTPINAKLAGINHTSSRVRKTCELNMRSRTGAYQGNLSCLVVDEITQTLPNTKIDRSGMSIPDHIHLADPEFEKPARVDILIGADLFWSLIGSRVLDLRPNRTQLRETKLGWIVTGTIDTEGKPTQQCHLTQTREQCNLTIHHTNTNRGNSEFPPSDPPIFRSSRPPSFKPGTLFDWPNNDSVAFSQSNYHRSPSAELAPECGSAEERHAGPGEGRRSPSPRVAVRTGGGASSR